MAYLTNIVDKLMSIENNIMGKISQERPKVRVIRNWRNSCEDRKGLIIFAIPKDICEMYDLNKPASLYMVPRNGEIGLKKVNLDDIQ